MGDIYWVDGGKWREPRLDELRGGQVLAIELVLPGQVDGWLVVADGYRLWKLNIKYQISTSRVMEVPVGLTRGRG